MNDQKSWDRISIEVDYKKKKKKRLFQCWQLADYHCYTFLPNFYLLTLSFECLSSWFVISLTSCLASDSQQTPQHPATETEAGVVTSETSNP